MRTFGIAILGMVIDIPSKSQKEINSLQEHKKKK
jgi:hypothetical protein